MGRKFKIYTLGCKVNQYDSGRLSNELESSGWARSSGQADIIIVNSCAVTRTAISKDRRMINRARSRNPEAKLVLIGCWPELYPREADAVGADIVLGVAGRSDAAKRILRAFGNQAAKDKQTRTGKLAVNTDRTRYFLVVQDGCEQFCSYCIIPYTRGPLKSRCRKEVLEEAETAAGKGHKEIVLSGIHLGLYGKDKGANGYGLADLAEDLSLVPGIQRIRLSSIEINEVTEGLLKLIEENKLCRHLHIPMQSGSPRILKLMNRPYTAEFFRERLAKIKELMPDIAITTDIIAGFPGETDEDFIASYDMAKELGMSRLHIFPFSAHPKTPAAAMKGAVARADMQIRAKKLRALGKELERQYKTRFMGRILDVLVEARRGSEYIGKTEYYFDIRFTKKDIAGDVPANIKPGEMVKVKLG